MPAIIGSGSGGDLNSGLTGGGGPVATAVAVVRTVILSATVGGNGLSNVLSAQATYGHDQMTGEARIICATPSGSIGDGVTLTMGTNPGTNVQRFSGTLVETDATLAPHSVVLLCKGPLYALETFKNDVETLDTDQKRPGLSFADIVGSQTGTLRQLVSAVLSLVGAPSLGSSDDPSHIYGTGAGANGLDGAFDEMTWGTHETAAAYINRFLAASAGYRLFDSSDGNIYLKQRSAIPGGADVTLNLGADILGSGHSVSTSVGKQAAVYVRGYDDGSGPAKGTAGSGSSAFMVNSPLIETDAFASELAGYWLGQVNRLQETVRLSTPRTELFGPAQTHSISGATTDSMWVKSTTCEVAANGAFTQHSVYVASG